MLNNGRPELETCPICFSTLKHHIQVKGSHSAQRAVKIFLLKTSSSSMDLFSV